MLCNRTIEMMSENETLFTEDFRMRKQSAWRTLCTFLQNGLHKEIEPPIVLLHQPPSLFHSPVLEEP